MAADIDPAVVALVLIAVPLWIALVLWVLRRDRPPPS